MARRFVKRSPKFVNDVERAAARAVLSALVRGTSELPAITPVDSSTLLNSLFRVVDKKRGKIVGTAGFTADYALAVHEAEGKLKGQPRPKRDGKDRGVYWGPHDGQPRFLAVAFEEARDEIDAIVREGLKL